MREERIEKVRQQKSGEQLFGSLQEGITDRGLPRDGGDRRNAGRAGHEKEQKCRRRGRAHRRGQVGPEKNAQHARHRFLGDDARKRRQRHFPAGDAHGVKEIAQPAAQHGEHALPALRAHIRKAEGKGKQEPERDEHRQHYGDDLDYKLSQRKKQGSGDQARRGKLQARRFEHEFLPLPLSARKRDGEREQDAREIYPRDREKTAAEKGGDQHQVHG